MILDNITDNDTGSGLKDLNNNYGNHLGQKKGTKYKG